MSRIQAGSLEVPSRRRSRDAAERRSQAKIDDSESPLSIIKNYILSREVSDDLATLLNKMSNHEHNEWFKHSRTPTMQISKT